MEKIEIFYYDLSNGWAKYFSWIVLFMHLDGIWHTSVFVHGREISYNEDTGVTIILGEPEDECKPDKRETIGYTSVDVSNIENYVSSLRMGKFNVKNYRFLTHNCNHFCLYFIDLLNENCDRRTLTKFIDKLKKIEKSRWRNFIAMLCRVFNSKAIESSSSSRSSSNRSDSSRSDASRSYSSRSNSSRSDSDRHSLSRGGFDSNCSSSRPTLVKTVMDVCSSSRPTLVKTVMDVLLVPQGFSTSISKSKNTTYSEDETLPCFYQMRPTNKERRDAFLKHRRADLMSQIIKSNYKKNS